MTWSLTSMFGVAEDGGQLRERRGDSWFGRDGKCRECVDRVKGDGDYWRFVLCLLGPGF